MGTYCSIRHSDRPDILAGVEDIENRSKDIFKKPPLCWCSYHRHGRIAFITRYFPVNNFVAIHCNDQLFLHEASSWTRRSSGSIQGSLQTSELLKLWLKSPASLWRKLILAAYIHGWGLGRRWMGTSNASPSSRAIPLPQQSDTNASSTCHNYAWDP